jgi:hypothetical protein
MFLAFLAVVTLFVFLHRSHSRLFFARWFVTVDLYPEDRLISGRLRKEDEKKMREERAKLDHHEKYG